MSKSEPTLDPERAKIVEELKKLGVTGIMITLAEQGEISKVECAAEENCLCPDELGGGTHFDTIPEPISDWIPTQDHITLKSEGGKLTVDNVQLMHRLCNRVRYTGEPGKKDIKRIQAARAAALIGPRFSIIKDDVEVDTATDYEQALGIAEEHVATIRDNTTGAVITFPERH